MNKFALAVAGILLLVSCGPAAPNATAQTPRPYEDRGHTPDARDVKDWHGYRKIDKDIGAICDRGNLIYRLHSDVRGGLAVVPNSPQCKRSLEP